MQPVVLAACFRFPIQTLDGMKNVLHVSALCTAFAFLEEFPCRSTTQFEALLDAVIIENNLVGKIKVCKTDLPKNHHHIQRQLWHFVDLSSMYTLYNNITLVHCSINIKCFITVLSLIIYIYAHNHSKSIGILIILKIQQLKHKQYSISTIKHLQPCTIHKVTSSKTKMKSNHAEYW